MSFKLRFALLFSLLVFIILSVSSLLIIVFNDNYRKQEFFQRLSNEAQKASDVYFKNVSISSGENLKIQYMLSSLPEEQVLIYNEQKQLVFSSTGQQKLLDNEPILEQSKLNPQFFVVSKRETVVHYFKAPKPHFIVASAYDKYGRSKAQYLRIILVISTIAGLILSAFLAFFYVRQIIKPLNQLKERMRRINEENLTDRLTVSDPNDELGSIAKNFNDMLDRLENSFQTRKNFVQHASHELRTPLANMLSQTEVALNQELDKDAYKRILLSLKEDQQDMISLTNSLLLLSQYDSWTQVEDWKTVRIDELVYETIEITKNVYRNAVISVDFETLPEDETHLLFRGNEMLLKSAFQNLIRNACNYSEDNLVLISIKPEPKGITINFNNRGKQLTTEEQNRLFIPFFRGDNSTNKKGFGLGLSIVQRILKLHGGHIRYYALDDNLNRFEVKLPASK